MQIDQLLKNYKLPETGFVNQRQESIQQFVDTINLDRVGTKYKMVTWSQINGLLAHIKDVGELYRVFRHCEQASCPFSAAFFGGFKKKKL